MQVNKTDKEHEAFVRSDEHYPLTTTLVALLWALVLIGIFLWVAAAMGVIIT